jgi:AcrR family transcriptional regulator
MTEKATPRRTYHHGDLREALLRAAEAELAEKGFEGFSLRSAAKRAGVSHAAPAHHFKDTGDLLTALATIAAERLTSSMLDRHARAEKTPREQFIASGVGYVEFALANPALFKLMFGSERPKSDDPRLMHHAEEAFNVLVGDVRAIVGYDPMGRDEGRLAIAAAWSMVHGIANLLIADRLRFARPMLDRDFEGTLTRLIGRVAPQ